MTIQTEVLKMAHEGVEIHSPNSPEYIVCAALIEALAQQSNEPTTADEKLARMKSELAYMREQQSNEQVEPLYFVWNSAFGTWHHTDKEGFNACDNECEKWMLYEHPPVPAAQPKEKAQLLFEVDGEMLTAGQIGLLGLYEFQQATGCDTAAEFLAQPKEPEQEPVAWITNNGDGWLRWHRAKDNNSNSIPLYTTSPQRTWVGLTDVEWMNIVNKDHAWFGQKPEDVAHEVAKLVEAKLKEKNTK